MIELQHLTKRFATQGGTVVALNDINLTIRDGDVYGIIGMSGAGKSTLVRCINMLERRSAARRSCICLPLTMTFPSSGRSSILIQRTSVDFPAPDIPMMP